MFKTIKSVISRGSDNEVDPYRTKNRPSKRRTFFYFSIVMYLLGFLTAVHAVMSTRTSQGATAWAIGSISFPYVAVPAYWVFGKSKFDGYEMLRHSEQLANDKTAEAAMKVLTEGGMLWEPQSPIELGHQRLVNRISGLPFTTGNAANLLVDGEQTFDAILAGIAAAKDYILFQFYILRDDSLGQDIKSAMLKKAAEGVRIYMQYDELGSKDLSEQYITELRGAGVQIVPFNTTQGAGNRLRLNFRNHRKIVVIDGKVAYVGGHNVGDEYLGKDPVLTPWRDTHVELRGPVVQCIQVPFVEDWLWATGDGIKNLNWTPKKAAGGQVGAACLPTGPADKLETGTLWYLHAINTAKNRLWIVSPYFVPDEQIMSALQLAALRGVDVRILIPQNPDHKLVYWTAISYFEEAEEAGVKIYRHQPGFLHQKVMLIDDYISIIGTHNLDNRSMRLNFEVTMVMLSKEFAREVEAMLENDLANSKLVTAAEYTESSLPYRFLIRASRLTAPVQ